MPISETLGPNAPSAPANPTQLRSDVFVTKGPGVVTLQAKAPNADWSNICTWDGHYVVETSDPAVQYQFVSSNSVVAAKVYFGP